MNSLKDYVLKFKIESKLCNDILIDLENSDWNSHEWYNSKEDYYYSNENDPDNSFLDSKNVNILREAIWDVLVEYGNLLSPHKKNYVEKYSHPKFNKYLPGQCMKVHVDHTKSLFEPDSKGNRGIPIMTVVGLLNDDFEGGKFFMRDEDLKLKKGEIIAFPSCFMFHHEVKPVLSGVRYSFVSWSW